MYKKPSDQTVIDSNNVVSNSMKKFLGKNFLAIRGLPVGMTLPLPPSLFPWREIMSQRKREVLKVEILLIFKSKSTNINSQKMTKCCQVFLN